MRRSIKFLIYRRYIKKRCIQKLTFYLWFVLKKCLFLQRNFAQNLNIIPIMIIKLNKISSLSSIDSSRVDVLLQSNGTWVCLVDGEPYLVESSADYAFVRSRLELLLSRIKGL